MGKENTYTKDAGRDNEEATPEFLSPENKRHEDGQSSVTGEKEVASGIIQIIIETIPNIVCVEF